MRCSSVLLGTSFDVGKFCTVLSQSCCAAFLPLVLSSLSCALLVIVQWLPGAPCFRVASWIVVAGVYRLALPARIVLFVFVSGVLGWVPDPCARFRSAHASRAPPGLGCCLVLTCRPCPRAMISVRARLYCLALARLSLSRLHPPVYVFGLCSGVVGDCCCPSLFGRCERVRLRVSPLLSDNKQKT